MDTPLVWWLMTAGITAVAAMVWRFMNRMEERSDRSERLITGRLDALQQLVSDEMRAMDVRIARLEAHIWPTREK